VKTKILISALFINILFTTFAFSKVKLFYPPLNSSFNKETITISGYSDEKISGDLVLKIEGNDAHRGKTRKQKIKLNDQNLFSVKMRLFPGTNEVSIGKSSRYVYYDDGSEDVPYVFSRFYEHSEPDCDNCHVLDPAFSKELTGEVNEVCSECHDQVKGKKNIHPGFEENTCIDCHDPHFSKYRGHLKKKAKKLCADCHDPVTKIKGAEITVVHPPVEQGRCANCHNPHASDNEFFLHKPTYELCTTCHTEPRDFGHADNYDDCTLCHEHHRAERFILLKDKYWENCLECHDEVADQKFKHLPKGRGCGDCHDPHSDTDLQEVKKACKNCHNLKKDKEFARFHANLELPVSKCFKCHQPHDAFNKRLLKSKLHFPLTQAGNCTACHKMVEEETKVKKRKKRKAKGKKKKAKKKKIGWIVEKSEVCFKCHGNKKPLMGYDESIHPPVLNGDCVQCHSPHLKLQKKQLLYSLEDLCYKCHRSFEKQAKKFKNGSLHPPVEERECLACHNPHKSENKSLLLIPPNKLCFECHDETKSVIEREDVIHYHNPPKRKICIECHSPHMSERPNLLKAEGEAR
jgi:predicted CXXCH cytochrome family protein